MLLTTPVDESCLLSPDDDSYHALVDPCWLRMLTTHITLSNAKPLMQKRFYVMRSCLCA
jgi:hypothetical protein